MTNTLPNEITICETYRACTYNQKISPGPSCSISIQRIVQLVFPLLIDYVQIYLMDTAIQLWNDWGLKYM